MVEPSQSSIPSISLCSISNQAVQWSNRAKPLFLLYLSVPLPARLCNGRAGPILYSFYISHLHFHPDCARVNPGHVSLPLQTRLCKGRAGPRIYFFYISLLYFQLGYAIDELGQSSIPSISLCSISIQAVQLSSRAKPLFVLYLSAPLQTRLCKGKSGPKSLFILYLSAPFQTRLCKGRAGPSIYFFYISLLYFQLGYAIDELGHVTIPFNISLLPSTGRINPV
jgi:hypothetical protein